MKKWLLLVFLMMVSCSQLPATPTAELVLPTETVAVAEVVATEVVATDVVATNVVVMATVTVVDVVEQPTEMPAITETTVATEMPASVTPIQIPTLTQIAMCTPPACAPEGTLTCGQDACPGGCGTICVLPESTNIPTPEPPPPATTPPSTISPFCANVTEIPSNECDALVSLYYATNGDMWRNGEGWLNNNQPCSWAGVGCWQGKVIILYLEGKELQGELPASFFNLIHLQELRLASNKLSGTLSPAFNRLTKLQEIDLTFNQFVGEMPASWDTMSDLETIRVGWNQLSGHVPNSYANLAKLQSLNLSDNENMSGPLPHWLTTTTHFNLTFEGTGLCIPTDDEFQTWIISSLLYYNKEQRCDDRLNVSSNSSVIDYFRTDIWEGDAGTEITLSWQVSNAATVAIQVGEIIIPNPYAVTPAYHDRLEGLPNSGSLTYTIPPRDCFSQIPFFLEARDTTYVDPVVNEIKIETVRRQWIFNLPADTTCPRNDAVSTRIVEQPFEHGRMVWVASEKNIYVIIDDGSGYQYPDYADGDYYDLTTDPTLTPPAGLLLPERGFGQLWSDYPILREGLGWATAPEQGFDSYRQSEYSGSRLSARYAVYVGGLDGFIWRFNGGYGTGIGWEKLTVPNP